MSILTGREIETQVRAGSIQIDPFNNGCINPASIDLTLGEQVLVYLGAVDVSAYYHHLTTSKGVPFEGRGLVANPAFIGMDVREELRTQKFTIGERGWLLLPGILYLMHTHERVHTERYVPILDGKSSIGRLGVVVHLTAGYGDPGFDGQYTLEVTAVHPVRVYAGMRFCQMRFHSLIGDHISYKDKGHYKGEDACGPVASKAFTQFE